MRLGLRGEKSVKPHRFRLFSKSSLIFKMDTTMNKKLIYTSIWLCLGGLAFSGSVWAAQGNSNSNKQSVKHCPQDVIDSADVVLTKQQPHGHVNDGGTLDDPTDDFYEICEDASNEGGTKFVFDGCTPVTIAEDTPLATDEGVDPDTQETVYAYHGLTILGSKKANTIEGTSGNDTICGQGGNDLVNGLEGDDIILGNNGNDTLIGGPGNDELYGGNGSDWLYGYDLDASDDLDDVEDLNEDSLVSDADLLDDEDLLEGGNGKDALFGGPNHDDLIGGNGNDQLNGDGGADQLDGGNGKDALNGGEDVDTIILGKGKDSCVDNDSDSVDDCPTVQSKGKKGGKKKLGH
jgi:hypothetical protein